VDREKEMGGSSPAWSNGAGTKPTASLLTQLKILKYGKALSPSH